MFKSDRLTLFFFITIIAIIFGFLFYIFDGDTGSSTKAPSTYIEDDMDEDDLDEELTYNKRRRGFNSGSSFSDNTYNQSSSDESSYSDNEPSYNKSHNNSSSNSSSSYTASSQKQKYQTPFFEKYYRKPISLNPQQKAQKIRNSLIKKGFKNPDYIEMKALYVTNVEADQAFVDAAKYANSDNPQKAIEILEDQLNNLNPKDLKTRLKLQQALISIFSNFGYPEKWQETVQQSIASRRKILDIKKSTILADNPRAQDFFIQEEKALNQASEFAQSGLPKHIENMIKNKGPSTQYQQSVKAGLINARNQSNSNISINDVTKSYKTIEKIQKKHWANPK
ncbi:MAG: hypothetical protein COB02_04850 [Candidatus Cloacimonadota bacterium]|nr:MAG: hypothetical protein COB02_04850 [Candidatus Cloacimonadota bacterium]